MANDNQTDHNQTADTKTALLLINLGTPEAPTAAAVRPYLREFLWDPRVVNVPAPLRWLLLNLIILPTRPAKSAAAYREIWTERGSPLLSASEDLAEQVQNDLDQAHAKGEGPPVRVLLAMRYGQPSLEKAVDTMIREGIDRVVVFPLYPQYASASTASSVERVMELLKRHWVFPALQVVPAFYDEPAFLDAQAAIADDAMRDFNADHIVFSFHGIPENHVQSGDPSGAHCLIKDGCCDVIGLNNRHCYRAHCVHTARGLAQRLNIPDDKYTITFQSRLGRRPWLKPYTDYVVPELAQKGVKRLAMFSPAFVADCLETLEELGIRAREDFEKAGGEAFCLIPCVNADPRWAKGVVELARRSGWLNNEASSSRVSLQASAEPLVPLRSPEKEAAHATPQA